MIVKPGGYLGRCPQYTLNSETTQCKSNMGSFTVTNSPLYKGPPKSPDRYTASGDIHTNLRNKHGIGKVRDMLMTLGNYRVRGGARVQEGYKKAKKVGLEDRGIWQWE